MSSGRDRLNIASPCQRQPVTGVAAVGGIAEGRLSIYVSSRVKDDTGNTPKRGHETYKRMKACLINTLLTRKLRDKAGADGWPDGGMQGPQRGSAARSVE